MEDQQALADNTCLNMAGPGAYENTESVYNTLNGNGHYVNEGDGHRVSNDYDYVNPKMAADFRRTEEGNASKNAYVDVPLSSQVPEDDHTYLELTNSGGHSARGPLPAPPGTTNASFEGGKGKNCHDKSSCGLFKTKRRLVILVGVLTVIVLILVIGLAVGLRTRVPDVDEIDVESTTAEPATIVPLGGICVRGPYGKQDSRAGNDNFSDEEFAANRTPSAFQFWTSEDHIVALGVRYDDDWGDIHGFWRNMPPNTAEFTSVVQILNPGEWVEDVYVGSDDDHEGVVPVGIYTVVQLQLVTNQRALPQVGYAAKDVEKASGQKLSFVSGWSALAIDVIKFHFLSC